MPGVRPGGRRMVRPDHVSGRARVHPDRRAGGRGAHVMQRRGVAGRPVAGVPVRLHGFQERAVHLVAGSVR